MFDTNFPVPQWEKEERIPLLMPLPEKRVSFVFHPKKARIVVPQSVVLPPENELSPDPSRKPNPPRAFSRLNDDRRLLREAIQRAIERSEDVDVSRVSGFAELHCRHLLDRPIRTAQICLYDLEQGRYVDHMIYRKHAIKGGPYVLDGFDTYFLPSGQRFWCQEWHTKLPGAPTLEEMMEEARAAPTSRITPPPVPGARSVPESGRIPETEAARNMDKPVDGETMRGKVAELLANPPLLPDPVFPKDKYLEIFSRSYFNKVLADMGQVELIKQVQLSQADKRMVRLLAGTVGFWAFDAEEKSQRGLTGRDEFVIRLKERIFCPAPHMPSRAMNHHIKAFGVFRIQIEEDPGVPGEYQICKLKTVCWYMAQLIAAQQ